MAYKLIQEVTVGTSATVMLSSIPQTFTDLEIEFVGPGASTGVDDTIEMQFNGDTGTNYSYLFARGNGSASSSGVGMSGAALVGQIQANTTTPATILVKIGSYRNTAMWKTVLSRDGSAGDMVNMWCNVWKSTSAVTSILILDANSTSNMLAVGTTIRLWGIS